MWKNIGKFIRQSNESINGLHYGCMSHSNLEIPGEIHQFEFIMNMFTVNFETNTYASNFRIILGIYAIRNFILVVWLECWNDENKQRYHRLRPYFFFHLTQQNRKWLYSYYASMCHCAIFRQYHYHYYILINYIYMHSYIFVNSVWWRTWDI